MILEPIGYDVYFNYNFEDDICEYIEDDDEDTEVLEDDAANLSALLPDNWRITND